LRSKEEREKRQTFELRQHFIFGWTQQEIADHQGYSRRTVERDFEEIRNRLRSSKDLDHEIRDTAEKLKLRHEEIIKLLWNDYTKSSKEAEAITKEFEALRIAETEAIETGAKDVLIQSLDKQRLFTKLLEKCERLLAQITDTDSQFVEQMRKLGLVRGEMDVDADDGSFLLQIKARKANIEQIRGGAKLPVPANDKK
jgi:hypothetical protein